MAPRRPLEAQYCHLPVATSEAAAGRRTPRGEWRRAAPQRLNTATYRWRPLRLPLAVAHRAENLHLIVGDVRWTPVFRPQHQCDGQQQQQQHGLLQREHGEDQPLQQHQSHD